MSTEPMVTEQTGPMGALLRGPALAAGDVRRLDQRVDHWARTTPDAVALRCAGGPGDGAGGDITYAELVRAATRVAAGLAAAGVGPGDIVAVRIPRGVRLAQALLAVLKRGATYAAVDPAWPEARCAQLVAQTGARWLLGDARAASTDAHAGGAARLDFDTLLGCDEVVAPVPGDDDTPCCVFLTSGSSGTPKAALVRHRAIVRIALDPTLGFGSGTRMLQTAPCPWDAYAMELWCPLVHGGTSVLYAGSHVSPRDVRDAVEGGVNTLFLTTALFNLVADTDPTAFAGLDVLMTGGERASARHFDKALAANPGLRLLHVYGPVESCVYTNAYPLPATGAGDEVPVGWPMAGTTVYLLDAERRPVRPGEVGEIAVAGDGLAVGYVNAPELTERAFPTLDLEPGRPPVRVYLTGDYGRIEEGRGLVFAGRRDRQVKIRGVRIEPAEVEAAIEAVPGVARAVVVALPHGAPTKTHLAACVVPDGDGVDETLIREAVRRGLPTAFVPDVVVTAPELPLNANGKVDQAAVAALVERHRAEVAAAKTTAAAPADGLPERVRELMDLASGLVETPIGPDEDIFAAGGTSIMAIRIAHWLSERGGVKVNALQVMEAGTPRALAALIGQAGADRPAAAEPGPVAAERSEQRWLAGLPVPQWRFWYLEAQHPGGDDTRCPLEFRLTGPLDAAALGAALRAVIARHEALRTRLIRVGARGVRAEVLDPAEVPDPLTVYPEATPEDARRLLDRFLATPFDLEQDLPIRAALVPLGGAEHLLAFSVHHTAFDGWSAGLLCRDLSVAYGALTAGRPLPEWAPTSFAESWLDQDLRETPADRAELDTWSRGLVGVPDLPIVAPGELAPDGPVREVVIDVPESLFADARRVGAACGGTAQAVLLAAWVRALRKFAGVTDLAIGIPVAGRTTAAAQDVIGCFASAVAVRFRSDSPGTGDAAGTGDADVRAAVAELGRALRFQFTPIERVLRASEPRDRTRNPFCQAGFVAQNNEPAVLDLPGVTCREVRHVRSRSGFELTLELWYGETLDARIWYRADVLSPAQADELAASWRAELEILAGDRVTAGAATT